MPKEELESLMTELHELFGTGEPSDKQRQLLQALDDHVHTVGSQEPVDPPPLATLELLVEQMGDEHPRTKAVLNEVMNTLKNIGI